MSLLFTPDWSVIMTAEESERELANFKFIGPGWYTREEDTLIVIPIDRSLDTLWDQKFSRDERFHFCVYNHRSPIDMLNRLVHAPHRESK